MARSWNERPNITAPASSANIGPAAILALIKSGNLASVVLPLLFFPKITVIGFNSMRAVFLNAL